MVAKDLQEAELLLLDMKVGGGDFHRQRVGGLVQRRRQGVGDDIEDFVEPVIVLEAAAAFLGDVNKALGIEIGEDRHLAHDVADLAEFLVGHRPIGSGDGDHHIDQSFVMADRPVHLVHGFIPVLAAIDFRLVKESPQPGQPSCGVDVRGGRFIGSRPLRTKVRTCRWRHRHSRSPSAGRGRRAIHRLAVRGGPEARRAPELKAPDSVLFETGYGPSGLPHIGTFGEVARTSMVRIAFRLLTRDGVPTRLLCFSDDLDGLRKVPDNVRSGEDRGSSASR